MSDTAGSTTGSTYVTVTFEPDPGFEMVFDTMTATEELGRPFLCVLEMSSITPVKTTELEALLGASVTIAITKPDKSKRYFNGIVARMAYAGLYGGAVSYRIELRPWIWLLSRTQDCRIFQNKSAWTIINEVFNKDNFTGVKDERKSQGGSTVLEYCVQYRETSFDFVTRLMEEFGLYYYFEHSDGDHKIVIADDPNSHQSIGAPIPFQHQETEMRAVEDHIWQWSSELVVQPGAYTYRDYNFTTPGTDLTAKTIQPGGDTYGSFEIFDYPGPYDTAANGRKLSDIRMQDLKARRHVLHGTSNSRRLQTGHKFTLSGFYQASEDGAYLVVRATYSLTVAESLSDTEGALRDTFRCSFQAIKGDTPFRLDCQTKRPMIRGPQTAKVVGGAGDEITTDQYGRIKVQFYWDRVGTYDENSSCWIRVAQVWAGVSWGGMFIPRVGQEVVVEFLEGNPDRPIITGCVYNANQTVPYGLPDNKTRSTVKSNSSLGGGGFNELRFEDKKGDEEVFFQAQKDYNKVVLHSETVAITQDTTTTVKQGNRAVTVSQGNDSLTVSMGNHSIEVSAGTSKITAAQSITLTVGPNSITIDTSGIKINGIQIGLTADASITLQAPDISIAAEASLALDGGAAMTLEAGEIAIN
jgi:type VI secretion system secreted protein VgrG